MRLCVKAGGTRKSDMRGVQAETPEQQTRFATPDFLCSVNMRGAVRYAFVTSHAISRAIISRRRKKRKMSV